MFPSGRFQTVLAQDSPSCGGGFVALELEVPAFCAKKNHSCRQKYGHSLENSHVPWSNFQLYISNQV